ncbi:MAG: hypothetical protein KDK66_04355, partial [Deltaproteobacteria bacterium]|nr:hypothetical protein [Deltaproteobacteria bacterium]
MFSILSHLFKLLLLATMLGASLSCSSRALPQKVDKGYGPCVEYDPYCSTKTCRTDERGCRVCDCQEDLVSDPHSNR